jgi:hypothetical protein
MAILAPDEIEWRRTMWQILRSKTEMPTAPCRAAPGRSGICAFAPEQKSKAEAGYCGLGGTGVRRPIGLGVQAAE